MERFGFIFKREEDDLFYCSEVQAKDFGEAESLLSFKAQQLGKIVHEEEWNVITKTAFASIEELDKMLKDKNLKRLSEILHIPERKDNMNFKSFANAYKEDLASLQQDDRSELKFMHFGTSFKELKETEDGFFMFEGLASTFDNVDLGGDMVVAGAFSETLSKRRPKLLWQHDPFEPAGVIDEAFENPDGLVIRGRLSKEDPLGARIARLVKMGGLDSFSIGYRTLESSDTEGGVRKLEKLELFEVSFVTFPMNEQATIASMKNRMTPTISVDEVNNIKTKRDFENVLRESGLFSKDAAVKMASKFQSSQSESDEEEELSETVQELKEVAGSFRDQLKDFIKEHKNV